MNKVHRIILAAVASVAAVLGLVAMSAMAASAATTATATTTLRAHPDSGNHGDWADAVITRTASVNVGAAHTPVTDCGASATSCFSATGKIADTGTFFSLSGALSPNAGVAMKDVKGSLAGGSDVTFLTSSNAPNANNVPDVITGPVSGMRTTTNWVEQFFPAGTMFGGGPNLTDWSWTYKAQSCETWVDAFNNGDGGQAADGDITGTPVSTCTNLLAARDVCGSYANRHWTVTNVKGNRRFTFFVATKLNSGPYFGLGHSETIAAGGRVSFITTRGTTLRLGYPSGTGHWRYGFFPSHVAAC